MKSTMLGLLTVLLPAALARAGDVSVSDTGKSTRPATWECTAGHPVEARGFTLDNGVIRYRFQYAGCVDPSHGEERPASEGNFGMPEPAVCNFYHSGFLRVLIGGKDAIRYRAIDMQRLEAGARGGFQALFAHPDATVGVRLMLLPGSNHVLMQVSWKPKPGADPGPVTVELRCYPSFFTSAYHRDGERHCTTPRIDEIQNKPLALVPAEDRYLFFSDKVFDVAKGEGDGPCATVVAAEGLKSGRVRIGSYEVVTALEYDPAAGGARLALYDFKGQTNAAAESYLKEHSAADLAELRAIDFRPVPVQHFDPAQFRDQVGKLLMAAGAEGKPLQARIEALLAKAAAEKAAADGGDWEAEARLGGLLLDSEDLLWDLKIFAMLNG